MARILTVSRNCHHPIETLKLRELSYSENFSFFSDNFSFLSARIRPAGRLVPVQTFSDDQNQENLIKYPTHEHENRCRWLRTSQACKIQENSVV